MSHVSFEDPSKEKNMSNASVEKTKETLQKILPEIKKSGIVEAVKKFNITLKERKLNANNSGQNQSD